MPVHRDWAAHPLKFEEHAFREMERGLTVRLIATREPRTCQLGDSIKTVLARRDISAFDYLPVMDGERTVGILHKSGLDIPAGTEVRVADKMQPLTDANLISADAGILTFVMTADQTHCRLVIDGDRIDAIVTLSDLQKLSVRPAVFLLITHVELLMAELIRRKWSEDDSWINILSEGRRGFVEKQWDELQKQDLAIDKISAAQFCDKRMVVLEIIGLLQPDLSRSQSYKDLKAIERLRDSVAHAGDYGLTRSNAIEMARRTRLTRDWIDRLHRILTLIGPSESADEAAGR
jgi:hypothetical protein